MASGSRSFDETRSLVESRPGAKPSIQHRVWLHVKAAVGPITTQEIAEQVRLTTASVNAAAHNLRVGGALKNVMGGGSKGHPARWVAVPGAFVPVNAKRPPPPKREKFEPLHVPPCELARIYGLVARPHAGGQS